MRWCLAQPHPRHSVVGGLLVGLQGDAGGEFGRHRPAVGLDVGDLAPGQTQAQGQAEEEGGEEYEGEGHGRKVVSTGKKRIRGWSGAGSAGR